MALTLRVAISGWMIGIAAWDHWRQRVPNWLCPKFAAGAVGALALPPFGFALAMIAPMTVAVWLIDGAAEASPSGATRSATLRAAFAIGWWWGFGYFLAGLWWLGAAFLVDGDQFLWALPFGVVGLPLVLAFFPALGFALARAIWPQGALRPLALAVGLTVSEFAARQCAERLSLERIWHGAGGASLGGAGGGFCRPAWPDAHSRCDFRRPGDAAFGLAADGSGGGRGGAPVGLRRASGRRARPGRREGRQAQDRAAQCRARAGLFAGERRGDSGALSQAVRPRDLARAQRRRRRHASLLAGIGVPVHPDATIAALWRASSISCTAAPRSSPGRRAPRKRAAEERVRYFNSIEVLDRSGPRPSVTTSTDWCRLASICRCARSSTARHVTQFVRCAGRVRRRRRVARRCACPDCPTPSR